VTDERSPDETRDEQPYPHHADESISDFAPQDWLLVIEALATTAGPPPERVPRSRNTNDAITRPRAARAWDLVSAIVAEIDLPPGEIAFQIDDDWRGPTNSPPKDTTR